MVGILNWIEWRSFFTLDFYFVGRGGGVNYIFKQNSSLPIV